MKSRATQDADKASRFLSSRVIIAITIFLLAFGVRVLTLHDTRLEVAKVQTGVAADYERVAHINNPVGSSPLLFCRPINLPH